MPTAQLASFRAATALNKGGHEAPILRNAENKSSWKVPVLANGSVFMVLPPPVVVVDCLSVRPNEPHGQELAVVSDPVDELTLADGSHDAPGFPAPVNSSDSRCVLPAKRAAAAAAVTALIGRSLRVPGENLLRKAKMVVEGPYLQVVGHHHFVVVELAKSKDRQQEFASLSFFLF